MGSIRESQNIMGSDYGSNISDWRTRFPVFICHPQYPQTGCPATQDITSPRLGVTMVIDP